MAAGNIMVAHKSGGPRLDIIVPYESYDTVGFLADTPQNYAETIMRIIEMTPSQRDTIRNGAKARVNAFSDECFEKHFLNAVAPLFLRHV